MIHIKSVPSKDQNQYIIMLVFGEVKVAKENFYGSKQSINIWDINIDNNFIWKLRWGKLLERPFGIRLKTYKILNWIL